MTGARSAAETLGLTALLADWIPKQRWFSARAGNELSLALTGVTVLPYPGEAPTDVVIEVHVVAVLADDVTLGTYQVPVTLRRVSEPSLEAALIGVLEPETLPAGDPEGAPTGERVWVYDGPRDPLFVTALVAALGTGDDAPGEGLVARGRLRDGVPAPDPFAPTTVIAGEQSNTSIIIRDEPPVIAKVFRFLAPGANPDIAVPGVLSDAGTRRVPQLVGWVEGEWFVPGDGPVSGHLASVSEFVAGSEDGWKLACVAVENGVPFTSEARDLGAAIAEVHAAMAASLPTHESTPESLGHLAQHLRDRLSWALDAAPLLRETLGDRLASAEAVYDAVAKVEGAPPMQQIHGDLHLGQTLHGEERGWVVLDFEGEPLRPLAERTAPDLALRDVAGMLRSFDYAARQSIINSASPSSESESDPGSGSGPDDGGATEARALAADAWAADCRAAFLDGYASVAGDAHHIDIPLLVALELDKALYEVVYETRHRPTWAAIPLSAVTRLVL